MKTVLITGSSRGLGKALAGVFDSEGYRLVLHSKSTDIIDKHSDRLAIIKGDLMLEGTIEHLASNAVLNNIDILINSAGIYQNDSFEDTSPAEFKTILGVNLIAPILLTKAIWPIFEEKKRGLIVNINSLAGRQGSPGETAYAVSKHGLRGFSRALKYDASKNNIRVLDVFLGAMNTDMTKDRKDQDKLIDPKEAARTIFSLCDNYKSLMVEEIHILRRMR